MINVSNIIPYHHQIIQQTNIMPDTKHDNFNHKENKYPIDAVTYSINELFS